MEPRRIVCVAGSCGAVVKDWGPAGSSERGGGIRAVPEAPDECGVIDEPFVASKVRATGFFRRASK